MARIAGAGVDRGEHVERADQRDVGIARERRDGGDRGAG